MSRLFTLFILFLFQLSYAQLESGLVAYWPFDGNANDVSGNGHNGLYKTVTWTSDRSSTAGCAVSVDQSVSGIVISDDLSGYFQNSSFSLSFWFRKKQGSNYSIGYVLSNSCTSFYDLEFTQSYSLFMGNKSIDLSKEAWYHVVYAYTGDSVRLYVNSQKVVSFARKFSCLSGYGSQIASELNGSLDDFRFYSRILSDKEIAQLYNLPSSCSFTTALEPEKVPLENKKTILKRVDILGQEIQDWENYAGIALVLYTDGSCKKVLK